MQPNNVISFLGIHTGRGLRLDAIVTVNADLGPDRAMTGIEFKMNFFAAGDPTGPALRAVARPLRIGRTIAVCESEVHQGDRRLAKGTFTYLLRERIERPS